MPWGERLGRARWIIAISGVLLVNGCSPSARQSLPLGRPARATALTQYVNPFIGTSGDGNVFPGATVPFGMVQWSPDTSAGGLSRPGGYAYGDRIISGFGVTHLSGAGCVAFGNIPIMPTVRPVRVPPQPNGSPYSDRFVHSAERTAPGYYGVTLASGIGVQLTTTPRTGFGVFTFPSDSPATLLVNAGGGAGGHLNTDGALHSTVRVLGPAELAGSVRAGHFCNLGNTYTLYFDVRFSRPFTRVAGWQGSVMRASMRAVTGTRTGMALTFSTGASRTVVLKIGLSYVSVRNAQQNLAAEDAGWSFARVQAAARKLWETVLSRARATGGSPTSERIFYTALYHAFLHPNVFSDSNSQYMGFDDRVHTAGKRVHYANFSGWDIYRSEIQLLAYLLPHETSDMMQSMMDDAIQLGALPKWPVANGETGEMNGDAADPILAGAFAFGARQFPTHTALDYMVKGATSGGAVSGGYEERPGLAGYLRLGYIPGFNPPEIRPYGAAATTLEYNIADFAIAQMARDEGKIGVYRTFLARSHTWRRLFDPATGLIEPRLDGGAFPASINPTSLDGYVEGNALQYTWMVPHDLAELVRLIGGTHSVVNRLDPLFTRLDVGPTDPYDWAGNEPGFTLPWVYDFAGAPWRTQAVVRHIMVNRYTSTVGGLPGNDDLGALSSWYVWAALGLYPEVPGVAGWAITSPLFPRIVLHSENGTVLTITTRNAGATYIQDMRVDGRPQSGPWLPLTTLRRFSTLSFTLGASANTRWGL